MKLIVCQFLCFAILSAAAVADDALGGAKPPVPDMSLKRDWQYKRVHQLALRYILLGRLDEADSFLHDYLKEHPDDAETYYMLGVLAGQRGELDQGSGYLEKAVELGLPPGRIVAGPREVMQPLAETAFVKQQMSHFAKTVVHGPLVGEVTDTSASIWVRTGVPSSVTVKLTQTGLKDRPKATWRKEAETSANSDFTGVYQLHGLTPDTRYQYQVVIDGNETEASIDQYFRTMPAVGTPSKFSLAFGGGAGYVPENERMWDTIDSLGPRLMLLLGDNVYIDDPESPVMQQYTYQRRQSRPEWRRLTAHTPTFTIWDDHDFSVNDSWGGPHVDVPRWKFDYSWPIFQQNWANPRYESGNRPGCWYTFNVGDVDFVMLDCRYYRTDPEGDAPTMLGPVQLAWLKQTLQGLSGTFKVICSSVPFDYRTKGDSLDTWNGYKSERDEIFNFITENKIEGVLLMSADRHRSDAWRIDRAGTYPLYEFNSSRLTNQHVHETMEKAGAIFSYNAKQSFGLVEFDTTADDPTVKYTVINIDGERVDDLTVQRSELN
ncbi:MAG: alkaline phosphatase D family protein [Planctomycetaceae bacterium]|nr:alkaline phosphatase D family protein [Planctomycetaceae bacterium]